MPCYAMPCTVTLGDVRVCMYVCMYVRHKAGEKPERRLRSSRLAILFYRPWYNRNPRPQSTLKLVSSTRRGSSFEDPAARVDEVGSRPRFPQLFFKSHGERATCQKARSICRCKSLALPSLVPSWRWHVERALL